MQTPTLNDLGYKAHRVLVLGTTGTGKSTLTSRYIDLSPAQLVFVYDWQGGEYAHRLGQPLAKSREEFKDMIDSGRRIICYDAEAGEGRREMAGPGAAWFFEFCFEFSGYSVDEKLIVADEAHKLMTTQQIPPEIDDVLSLGRRKRMNSLLVGRAPNAMNTLARDQISDVYFFRSMDENSLKFAKSFNLDTDEIRALPDCHFVHFSTTSGETKRLALWDKNSKAVKEVIHTPPQPKEI